MGETAPRLRGRDESWQRWVDRRDTAGMRPVIAESWRRSAHLPATARGAPRQSDDVITQWNESALARSFQPFLGPLAEMAGDDFLAAVVDRAGNLVWRAGRPDLLRRADRITFIPGTCWDEALVGTNGPGVALQIGQPVDVVGGEHYAEMARDWSCYSAPVHDVTGSVVAAVDLSTLRRTPIPLARAAVAAMARSIELGILAPSAVARRVAPDLLTVRALGVPAVRLGTQFIHLTPRQMEILTVLSLNPDGLSYNAIDEAIYGDRASGSSTLRVEVLRLRSVLGAVVGSRPYRIAVPFEADHRNVLDHLYAGRVTEAIRVYGGPLLPYSDAPAIVAERNHLEVAVRRAVLRTTDVDDVFAYAKRHRDDVAVHQRLASLTAESDPRRLFAETCLDAE